jgi:hypothetical protein
LRPVNRKTHFRQIYATLLGGTENTQLFVLLTRRRDFEYSITPSNRTASALYCGETIALGQLDIFCAYLLTNSGGGNIAVIGPFGV